MRRRKKTTDCFVLFRIKKKKKTEFIIKIKVLIV